VTRYPRLQKYIRPASAGAMLNEIRPSLNSRVPCPALACVPTQPINFLLAMAAAAKADYLVTGDERHLLRLELHEGTRIVTARQAAEMLGYAKGV
jgi:uncharacterized protein